MVLHIPEAFEEDTGVYAVRVQSELGACGSQATLLVQPQPLDQSPKRRAAAAPPTPVAALAPEPSAPPEFLKLFRDYRATRGENVALDCVLRAVPKASIVWTFNGEPISERPGIHITEDEEHYGLLLEQVTERVSGRYAITAENSSGRATCSALLTVLSPPPPPSPDSWSVRQPISAAEQIPAKVAKLFAAPPAAAAAAVPIAAAMPERRRSPIRALQQPGAPRFPSAPAQSETRVPQKTQPQPVAPRFVKLLNDLSAEEGSRVQFDAVVEGFPEPSIQVCLRARVCVVFGAVRCVVQVRERSTRCCLLVVLYEYSTRARAQCDYYMNDTV